MEIKFIYVRVKLYLQSTLNMKIFYFDNRAFQSKLKTGMSQMHDLCIQRHKGNK